MPDTKISALASKPTPGAGDRAVIVDATDGSNKQATLASFPVSTPVAAALGQKADASALATHAGNTANPHAVTAAQVGAYATGQADALLAGKAPVVHAHAIADVSGLPSALAGKAPALVPVAVAADHDASAREFVSADATAGTVTVTLPEAPADGTTIGVKLVATSGANVARVAASGADVFNRAGGSVVLTLGLVNYGTIVQYHSGVWTVVAGNLSLAQLDARFATPASVSSAIAALGLGTIAAHDAADYVTPATLATHTGNTANPHAVTRAQVGLGSVDNTSDLAKPVSTAQQAALDLKADDAGVVHRAGAETIAGAKTFSSTIVGSITGNAGTATNGVVTTGSYADPAWIASLAGARVVGNIAGTAGGLSADIPESRVTGLVADLAAKATAAQGAKADSAVQSIALATPNLLFATPITFAVVAGAATGTLALNTQAANTVLAGPTTGSAAAPTMRALVAADIPALPYAPTAGSTSITTLGTVSAGTWNGSVIGPAYLGTGTRDGTKFLRDDGSWQAGAGGASTSTANTWTAQQVFQVGASGGSPAVFRQTGGTAGTAEVQVGHDGTHGKVSSRGGDLKLDSSGSGSVAIQYFGSDRLVVANTTISLFSPSGLYAANAATTTLASNYAPDGARIASTGAISWSSSAIYFAAAMDVGLARHSAGVVRVTDGGSGYGDLKARTPFGRRNAEPADAELVAGEWALWLDATDGAPAFKIKAKSANGTVVRGSVALS